MTRRSVDTEKSDNNESGGDVRVRTAYRHCARLARRSASNFYFAFWLLPRPKRRAMCALYAFMRQTDDLADSDLPIATRRQALANWRKMLQTTLDGGPVADPVLLALRDAIERYAIPTRYLEETIDGVEQDLDSTGFANFGQLEEYCYRVASTVGLLCIHIWGFQDERALAPARQCGIAFQLTNILRDLHADARVGRCYIPREDLSRFGCTEADILRGDRSERMRSLIRFQLARAEEYYQAAAALPPLLNADGQRVFSAMYRTYATLWQEIKRRDGDLFGRRIQLGRWQKAAIAARSLLSARPASFIEVTSA